MGPLETLPIEDFRKQIEVNLIGQVAVAQAMLPLIRRATGRVVLVSSGGGRMALPFGGAYHAAKFGLEGVADSLRQELRPWGIEVIVIEPGSIDTPIWERAVSGYEEMAARAPARQRELYGERLAKLQEGARGPPPAASRRTGSPQAIERELDRQAPPHPPPCRPRRPGPDPPAPPAPRPRPRPPRRHVPPRLTVDGPKTHPYRGKSSRRP